MLQISKNHTKYRKKDQTLPGAADCYVDLVWDWAFWVEARKVTSKMRYTVSILEEFYICLLMSQWNVQITQTKLLEVEKGFALSVSS